MNHAETLYDDAAAYNAAYEEAERKISDEDTFDPFRLFQDEELEAKLEDYMLEALGVRYDACRLAFAYIEAADMVTPSKAYYDGVASANAAFAFGIDAIVNPFAENTDEYLGYEDRMAELKEHY